MFKVGCHLSSSKGFLAMGKNAVSIGANTFQFFSRNPRGGSIKPLNEKDIAAYLVYAKEYDLQPVLAHAPYVLNPGTSDGGLREFTRKVITDDLARLERLPGSFYNLHPGSHGKQGVKVGIERTASLLNEALRPDQSTTVLIETMYGTGSALGATFEELKAIIDGVIINDRLGVCLDTCHVFVGGYDIVHRLDQVLAEFDKVVGLDRLKVLHLNDSMHALGSKKDRHAKIGEGALGLDTFSHIINHAALRDLPFYLETPNDLAGHAQEIALLKSFYQK